MSALRVIVLDNKNSAKKGIEKESSSVSSENEEYINSNVSIIKDNLKCKVNNSKKVKNTMMSLLPHVNMPTGN